jgi:hypothetical protein
MTNGEFREVTPVVFGNPSQFFKEHFSVQTNEETQFKTIDMYGENVKTAAGVPGGSFMHVHEAMVNVVGDDPRNAHIMLKSGIDTFSGAVNGNMELKKRLSQNILPGMIINAQDDETSSIILASNSAALQAIHTNMRKVSLKVWKFDRNKPREANEQLFKTST